jgi:hypothetical protein
LPDETRRTFEEPDGRHPVRDTAPARLVAAGGASAVTLTHGRTRKRWAQRVALILYVIAGLIFFVAWAIMLALLILIVTN